MRKALLYSVGAAALCLQAFNAIAATPHQADEVTPQVQQLYAEAHAAQASGDTATAIEKYRRMLQLAPHLAPAYNNLGMLYFNAHDYPEAAHTLARGVALNPEMPSAQAMLGMSYLEMGEADKAEAPLEAALRAHPDDDQVQMSFARDQLGLGHNEKAAAALRVYIDHHPKDEQAWYLLGKTYLQLSEAALGKVTTIDPNSVYAHEVAGEIDASMHNYDGALVEYQKAVAQAPKQPGVHMHMADAFWETGKWDSAQKEYAAELVNDPNNCQAHWKLGDSMLEANGSPADALTQLDAAVQGCPELMQARVDRARALVKLQRAPEALPDLLLAEKADPDEPSIHFLLAAVYRAQGKPQDVRQQMQTYAQLQQQQNDAQAKQAGASIKLDATAH
jgi:tetratricopeptide (TPR) repeat protein